MTDRSRSEGERIQAEITLIHRCIASTNALIEALDKHFSQEYQIEREHFREYLPSLQRSLAKAQERLTKIKKRTDDETPKEEEH
jgi:hypothetical protein